MEKFKTWELIYNAKLVSTSHLNVALLHETIAKALRDNAGSIGYLVGRGRNGDGTVMVTGQKRSAVFLIKYNSKINSDFL